MYAVDAFQLPYLSDILPYMRHIRTKSISKRRYVGCWDRWRRDGGNLLAMAMHVADTGHFLPPGADSRDNRGCRRSRAAFDVGYCRFN